eukprot:946429-Lingulodinium_polyedra.AAC.1
MKWWAQAIDHVEDNDCILGCRRDFKENMHLSLSVGSVPHITLYNMNTRKSCSSPRVASIVWNALDPRAMAVDMPFSPDLSPDRSRTAGRIAEPGAPLRG